MLEIECKSVGDYLVVLTGLCGACEKTLLLRLPPTTPAYAEKVMKKLKDDRTLTESKTPHGKVIRLGINGYEALSQIPLLKEHYDTITDNNKVRIDKKNITRFIGTGTIISEMVRSGIPVDEITLKYTNQTAKEKGRKGGEAGHKEVLEDTTIKETEKNGTGPAVQEDSIPPGPLFISGQIIKRQNKIAGSTNQSRARGAIIGDGYLYATYYMDGPMKFMQATESSYSSRLFLIYEKLYGREAMLEMERESPKGSAIVFVNSVKDTESILDGSWNMNAAFLTGAYSHVYIVPAGNKKVSMYLARDMKKKILESNYYQEELDAVRKEGWEGMCDAVVDGRLSSELLTMDVNVVRRIEKGMKATEKNRAIKFHILCDPFQVLLLRDYFKDTGDRVSIEEV